MSKSTKIFAIVSLCVIIGGAIGLTSWIALSGGVDGGGSGSNVPGPSQQGGGGGVDIKHGRYEAENSDDDGDEEESRSDSAPTTPSAGRRGTKPSAPTDPKPEKKPQPNPNPSKKPGVSDDDVAKSPKQPTPNEVRRKRKKDRKSKDSGQRLVKRSAASGDSSNEEEDEIFSGWKGVDFGGAKPPRKLTRLGNDYVYGSAEADYSTTSSSSNESSEDEPPKDAKKSELSKIAPGQKGNQQKSKEEPRGKVINEQKARGEQRGKKVQQQKEKQVRISEKSSKSELSTWEQENLLQPIDPKRKRNMLDMMSKETLAKPVARMPDFNCAFDVLPLPREYKPRCKGPIFRNYDEWLDYLEEEQGLIFNRNMIPPEYYELHGRYWDDDHDTKAPEQETTKKALDVNDKKEMPEHNRKHEARDKPKKPESQIKPEKNEQKHAKPKNQEKRQKKSKSKASKQKTKGKKKNGDSINLLNTAVQSTKPVHSFLKSLSKSTKSAVSSVGDSLEGFLELIRKDGW